MSEHKEDWRVDRVEVHGVGIDIHFEWGGRVHARHGSVVLNGRAVDDEHTQIQVEYDDGMILQHLIVKNAENPHFPMVRQLAEVCARMMRPYISQPCIRCQMPPKPTIPRRSRSAEYHGDDDDEPGGCP